MPSINPQFLDCVIYIYKNKKDALDGESAGGSGFLVHVPFENNKPFGVIYAVTNNHVINKCLETVAIRLNTVDGVADVVETNPNDWKRHSSGADIRAIPIKLDFTQHKYISVPKKFLLSLEIATLLEITPGHDVFMVGRFINKEGKQKNTPSVRFGSIAMMPHEPIEDGYGIKQESFLVECRSIPGFSGSPVFVRLDEHNPFRLRQFDYKRFVELTDMPPIGPWLLGVDWCHLPSYEPICDVQGDRKTKRYDMVAQSNTSMAGVIPAWLLIELLDDEEFMAERKEEDDRFTRLKESSVVAEDVAGVKEQAEFTRDDFEDALKKASRRKHSSE
jgi:hypothetical protein